MKASKPGSSRTDVNQGDIIHQPANGDGRPQSWGFIVTADCDIAKDKAGAKLSYLEIVTAHDYLEHVWSGETLRKVRKDLVGEAAALVTKAARELDPDYEDVSAADLLAWLADSNATEIVTALGVPPKKKAQHLEALERVELAHGIRGGDRTALQRLRRVWTTQNTGEKTVKSRLVQALDYNKATDFHLIPSMPGSDLLGFVVLLREIGSVPHASVASSALECQIAGDPDGFYVAGPSTDNLRYAISQKMGSLFSRIGMSDEYEAQCEVVTELAIENVLSPLNNNGTQA